MSVSSLCMFVLSFRPLSSVPSVLSVSFEIYATHQATPVVHKL